MTEALPDIPRLVTAIAEWLGVLLYLVLLPRRLNRLGTAALAVGGLGVLIALQELAGRLPLQLWTPAMLVAVAVMFVLVRIGTKVDRLDGAYLTMRAFVLAELVASLAWQLHLFYFASEQQWLRPTSIALLAAVFIVGFGAAFVLERRHYSSGEIPDVGPRTLSLTIAITVITFALSNLSFISTATPFSGTVSRDVFYIRTLVDLCGFVALYAQHEQLRKARADAELAEMDAILRSQHDQYLASKREVEQANTAWHDLKHQVALIRAELDPDRRSAHLDDLENQMTALGVQHRTGNPVVDTVLTAKARFCRANQIQLTCVADGTLLNGLATMDLASLLGNALDNAIESVLRLAEPEQRLIKVAIYPEASFVIARFENFFDGELRHDEAGELATRKADATKHGLGLKSIRQTAEKYGGQASTTAADGWFTLTVLLPADVAAAS